MDRTPDLGREFPSTRWSRLLADPAAGSAAGREALEMLARRYWRPIAGYVRAHCGSSPLGAEDALDVTQEFFAWLLETRLLERADPARGSFRGFLKRCLANFLNDLERGRRAEKRGGGRIPLSLPAGADEAERQGFGALQDPTARSPEALLDDLWRREVLGQATAALEAELRGRGKATTFEVFRDYFLGESDVDYAEVARRHGIDAIDVSNRLAYAKKRFRAHLRSAVLETVQDDEALRAELAWLLEGGSA